MTIRFAIYLTVILFVFLRGCWVYKKLSNPFKILCITMGLTFISESFSRVLIYFDKSSMAIYPIFSIVQYSCFALIFYHIFKSVTLKRFVIFTIPIMFVIDFLNTFYLQSLDKFPSNFINFMFTLVIILSIIALKQIFNEDEPLQHQASILYFSCALLIYLALILSCLGLINYFNKRDFPIQPLQLTILFSSTLFYSLVGRLFIIDSHQKK